MELRPASKEVIPSLASTYNRSFWFLCFGSINAYVATHEHYTREGTQASCPCKDRGCIGRVLIRIHARTLCIPSFGGRCEGRVERVGWYQTRLRGRDTRPTYVPNGMFSDTMVSFREI